MTHELSTTWQSQPASTDRDHLELARRANEAHRHVVGAARAAVKYALKAGRALAEAKRLCPSGAWGDWVDAHFDGSLRTAQRYVRLAQCWPQLEAAAHDAGRLSHNQAVRLLARLSERGEGAAAVAPRSGQTGRALPAPNANPITELAAPDQTKQRSRGFLRVDELVGEMRSELDEIIQSRERDPAEFAKRLRDELLIPAQKLLDKWFWPRTS